MTDPMSSLQVVHPTSQSQPQWSPTVDLIFVHGLNPVNHEGHALRTWTHTSGVCWPRDLLPSYVGPNARISVFSYNSNAAFATSSATVSDHADSLLDRLQALRQQSDVAHLRRSDPNEDSIPIIFVAHSLGGLVVKKALVRAQANERLYGSIPRSTRGLVFFGTPHHGGNGVGAGKIAANALKLFTGSPKNDIFQHLEKDSVFSKVSEMSGL